MEQGVRNRQRYPAAWRQLARACKERAGWCCQRCQVAHGTVRVSPWTGRPWPVYLQAAHIRHDPENEAPDLIAVCPTCHWRYYRKPGTRPAWVIEKMKHQRLIQQAYC